MMLSSLKKPALAVLAAGTARGAWKETLLWYAISYFQGLRFMFTTATVLLHLIFFFQSC